jgi:1-aminocyclopropane-1-carboxylate deaminase/D-cysteine desulfhydrase-like pyridoxal-dependent ACC family enzyme
MEISELRERIDRLPRARLAHLPTPLDDCPRLSAAIGVTVAVKRDDCTGLAFGGNKVRQHEFMLGDAIASGADCIIQGSASQSNHSRQLAAAGAKLGLDVYLLPKRDKRSHPIQGNYLLQHVLGATMLPIGVDESTKERKEELAAKLRAEGRRPYVVGMGATRSLTLAAVAYVEALVEIVEATGPDAVPNWIVSTSQGSTQAGLQLGCELLGLPTKVVGVNPLDHRHEAYLTIPEIHELVDGAAEMLGLTSTISEADIVNTTEYVGDGYGIPSEAGLAALRTLASTEGILLDPVYSAKGFAGLLDLCARGTVPPGDRVVFLHTGGLPALFTYAEDVVPNAA